MAYARGFNVPLGDISKRLADQVRDAMQLLGDTHAPMSEPRAAAAVERALPTVLQSFGGLSAGQWTMVRARLDALPGHPEAWEDVAADITPMLLQAPGKRFASG